MKLKKMILTATSVMLLFSTAGCGEKEQEQPKQPESQTAMKQEQPAKEEVTERIYKSEEEIFEEFPKLKEAEQYLLENYPTLSRKAQETEEEKGRKPISFSYNIGGGETDELGAGLRFDESVTKKEMVEAMQYLSKEMDSLFPEGTDINFDIYAVIAFSGDTYIKKYLHERGVITLKYKKGENTKYKWQEEIKPNERGTLYIEKIKPDDVVAYFGEETPEQPAVSKPQGTSIQLSTVLSHINLYYDTTESAREKDDQTGNKIVKGSNETGSCTYEITTNDKGEVLSGIYKITRTTEANDEEFKMNVRGYLCNSASAQFDGETGMKAFQVVSKCVEDVFDRAEGAEEEGTLEGVKFKIVVEKEKECIAMYVTN